MAYKTISNTTTLAKQAKWLRSWSFAESAGTPAAARVLIRNKDVNGDIVIDVRLDASQSKHQDYTRPVYFPDGIYVHVSTGSVRGSVDVL